MSAAVLISDALNRDRRSHFAGPGVYVMAGARSLATTELDDNDDKVILDKFPARGRLVYGAVHLTDVDGATSLVWDLSSASALDGTVDTVLIADSTVGRTAGSALIDTAKIGTNVGGDYLMFHVNTAAGTPAAGTITWYLLIAEDVDVQTHASSITSTQAANPGEDLT